MNFQAFDIIVLVILGGMTIMGGLKGMISQIASIASIIVSWTVASLFSSKIALLIPAEEPWNRVVAMLVLFVGCSILIWWFSAGLKSVFKRAKLKEFDRQMGALLGLIKGALICLVLTFFAGMLSDTTRSFALDSQSGKICTSVLYSLRSLIPEDVRHAELLKQLDIFQNSVDSAGYEIQKTDLRAKTAEIPDALNQSGDKKSSDNSSDKNANKNSDNSPDGSSGSPSGRSKSSVDQLWETSWFGKSSNSASASRTKTNVSEVNASDGIPENISLKKQVLNATEEIAVSAFQNKINEFFPNGVPGTDFFSETSASGTETAGTDASRSDRGNNLLTSISDFFENSASSKTESTPLNSEISSSNLRNENSRNLVSNSETAEERPDFAFQAPTGLTPENHIVPEESFSVDFSQTPPPSLSGLENISEINSVHSETSLLDQQMFSGRNVARPSGTARNSGTSGNLGTVGTGANAINEPLNIKSTSETKLPYGNRSRFDFPFFGPSYQQTIQPLISIPSSQNK